MNQLKAGVVLNYVIIILSALVGLLYTPYMLRMLGQSEYGLYSLVSSVVAYLTILDLGFGNALLRYTAKYRAEGKVKEQSEMFGMFLVLYSVIGVIAFIAGSVLFLNIDSLFGATMTVEELGKAKILMLIMVFNVAITFPLSIWGSIISAYEHFVFPKLVNIVRILLNTGLMIALLSRGYKAIAMVIVQTAFNIVTPVIYYIYCKKVLSIKVKFGKFQWGFLKEVAIYSFWIFLNIIMDRIYWSTGQFVLGIVSGTVAISVFAVAIQLQSMYMQFSSAISSVFLPKVTGMVATNKSDDDISDLFIRTGRVQNIVMMAILTEFIVFGKQFIILWAGEEYASAYPMTLMFFVGLYVPLIQSIGRTVLQARNQMEFRSIVYIILAVISLVMQFILAKHLGGIGCALAISGTLLLGHGLCMNIYYYKVQKLDTITFWKEIMNMNILPIAICFLSCLSLRFFEVDSWLKLIIGICIYLIVYIPIIFCFSMNSSERKLFTSFLNRKNA